MSRISLFPLNSHSIIARMWSEVSSGLIEGNARRVLKVLAG